MADPSAPVLRKLRWPLLLTRAGLLAERVLRAFWPLISVLLAGLALAMLGVQDHAPVDRDQRSTHHRRQIGIAVRRFEKAHVTVEQIGRTSCRERV